MIRAANCKDGDVERHLTAHLMREPGAPSRSIPIMAKSRPMAGGVVRDSRFEGSSPAPELCSVVCLMRVGLVVIFAGCARVAVSVSGDRSLSDDGQSAHSAAAGSRAFAAVRRGICLGWAGRTGVIRCRPRFCCPGDHHGRATGGSCYFGQSCAMRCGVDGLLRSLAARHNHMPLPAANFRAGCWWLLG